MSEGAPDAADEPTPIEEGGPPAGPVARCRRHGDRKAVSVCGRCGDFLCGFCAVWIEGAPYGPGCAERVRSGLLRIGAHVPWEDRARRGWIRAAYQTVRAVFADPAGFYARMPTDGGLTDPLLFAMAIRGMVVLVYGLLAAGVYGILGAAMNNPMMYVQAGVQLGTIVLQMVQVVIYLFVVAGLIHLGVRLVGGLRGFEATFRVYGYGRAVDVMELVPIVGPLAAIGYRVYLYYLGLQVAHRLTPGRSLSVALLPVGLGIFLTVLIVGAAFVIGFLLARA